MKQKSENRKAMPKFILIMICALLVGGVVGVVLVLADGDWTTQFVESISALLMAISPWMLFVTAAVSVLGVFLPYRKAKALHTAMQDPDDEEMLDRLDGLLNIALLVNNICSIASYFFIGTAFCLFRQMEPMAFLLCLIGFVCCLIFIILGQQKVVDYTKKLYPEKRGSVYDTKFAEKWYDSCDEAERAMICQAAFTSYKATNLTCVFLWLALVLNSMLFEIGLMPIAVVTVIWLVSTLSYCIKAMKLSKRK